MIRSSRAIWRQEIQAFKCGWPSRSSPEAFRSGSRLWTSSHVISFASWDIGAPDATSLAKLRACGRVVDYLFTVPFLRSSDSGTGGSRWVGEESAVIRFYNPESSKARMQSCLTWDRIISNVPCGMRFAGAQRCRLHLFRRLQPPLAARRASPISWSACERCALRLRSRFSPRFSIRWDQLRLQCGHCS